MSDLLKEIWNSFDLFCKRFSNYYSIKIFINEKEIEAKIEKIDLRKDKKILKEKFLKEFLSFEKRIKKSFKEDKYFVYMKIKILPIH